MRALHEMEVTMPYFADIWKTDGCPDLARLHCDDDAGCDADEMVVRLEPLSEVRYG
jgi:hypothetical protein